jgi:YesN/AraC family two-component response regulator
LLFFIMSIKILRHPLKLSDSFVHSGNTEISSDSILSNNTLHKKLKYRKSSFEKKNAERYLINLKILMTSEKPFLKSDLTLPQLAKKINLSTHHLSQLLNQEVNMSFIEFINSYRIKEAQNLLVNPGYSNHTILAISLEVGFNSKTSFNRMFKKYTGMTPSEFIRKNSRSLHKAPREYATQQST